MKWESFHRYPLKMKCLLSPLNIHILNITLRAISNRIFLHLIKVLKNEKNIWYSSGENNKWTLLLDLNGLMQRILYIFCITPYCNITVLLVKNLWYHKRVLIWCFIFVCSVVRKNNSIPNVMVIVKYMFFFSCVVSINLRLFSLMY